MNFFRTAVCVLILGFCFGNNFAGYCADNSDQSEIKRIDMPFIHIGVKKHSDGTKDVDVKAPFVKVHNPAGENNAQIKAPFTRVENGKQSTATQSANPSKAQSNTKVKTYSSVTKTQ